MSDLFADGEPAWMADGACRRPGVDPEWFFSMSRDVQAHAKRVCAVCPVREACLEFAYANDERGVWGGLNETERKRARRGAARANRCPKGHEYTPENTRVRANGRRACLTCDRDYKRKWMSRRRLSVIQGGQA